MKHILQWIPVCGCLLLAPAVARAQAPEPPPEGWSGLAQISIVAATGNSRTQTYGAGGELDYHRPGVWDALARVTGVRSSSESIVTASSLAAAARASRLIRARLHGFGDFLFLRNRFAGIGSREQVNGGLALDVLPPGPQTLQVFGSLGYLREVHVNAPRTSASTAGAGARYGWKISDHSTVAEELNVTQNLSDSGDVRVANEASVAAAIATALSLKLSQRVEYLHKPAPGFRTTDTLTSVALVVTF